MKSKIFCIAVLFGMLFTLNLTAQNLLEGKRIFLDPGHDGFGSNDRNIATINFPIETTSGLGNGGFYESKMNVWRGLETRRLLEEQGAIVGMSRTTTPQAVSLAARRDAAVAHNSDAYISIHSNAANGVANHPLVLWHETNRHPQSQRLASDMVWWIADNPLTSWDSNPPNRNNTRGQALGAINTTAIPAALTEDTFHDYAPEAHRYLSPTYNKMISFGGHYRGLLRFFGVDPAQHPTGIIMGWIKDDTRPITSTFPANGNRFLPFRAGSHDAFWPINGATVELLQNNIVIDTYTTDNNWNGVFGFLNLAPGNYQLRFIAEGYVTEVRDVTVAAGQITAANQILEHCDPNDSECNPAFPVLRLVMGTSSTAPFGTHVTEVNAEEIARLYVGIDQNNDPNNPSWIPSANILFTTSDRDVAAIDANGVISIRAEGTTVIRAIRSTVDGATGQITLTVTGTRMFCTDFNDPPSDGSFGLAVSYDFVQVGSTETIDPLAGLTVRRSILRDGKLYVLAVEADRSPRLLVINPETGDLITEMSTQGIEAHNAIAHNTEITNMFMLSDIGFTADGVLIGTNSTVAGVPGNQFLSGDFIVYKWQATETIALEDAEPVVFLRHLAAENAAPLGNNNSNFVGNSIAVSGCIDDMRLFFTSHPGAGWGDRPSPDGNFNILHMAWVIQDGVRIAHNRNNTGWMSGDVGARNRQMTLSPLGQDRYVFAGSNLQPTEIQFNWTPWVTGSGDPRGVLTPLSGDIPLGSTGATYFRYAGRSLMVSPILESGNMKARLFDITDGFNNARLLGETPVGITGVPAGARMFAAGAVDNADIYIYLMTGDQIAKFEVSDFTSGGKRIFAYGLTAEYNAGSNGYDVSFDLNYDANSVDIILTNVDTQAETIIPLGSLTRGNHQVVILDTQIPADGVFSWSVRASADPIARMALIDTHTFTRPRTVAIDNSPESPYFGRVYVGNSNHPSTPANQVGVFVLSPTGDDVTGQGNVAHAGTQTWSAAANEQNFRKLAIAEDGRIFVADWSVANSGVYIMNPITFEMTQLFTQTRGANGAFMEGSTYVGGRTSSLGVRGSGSNMQLFATMADPPNAWRQFTHIYNIGEASTWSTAPSFVLPVGAGAIGTANENNSIVPTAEGFWVGQFRGGSVGNIPANPYMYFFSNETNRVTFHTAAFPDGSGGNFVWPDWSSAHGALAVYEPERLVALVLNGGVQFFSYEFPPFSEGVPTVRMLYQHALGGSQEDFEFDFAGNFYTVSAVAGTVSVWAMPTSDNTKVTPARSTMLLARGGASERELEICDNELPFVDAVFGELTTSGVHETTLESGTDVKLTLTVHAAHSETQVLTICENELPFTWRGNILPIGTTSGLLTFNEETIHGCDSIVTLNLTVNSVYNLSENLTICENELPFTWRGNILPVGTTSGELIFNEETIHGCDSIVTLNLTVHPTVAQEYSLSIYEDELPYVWRGNTIPVGTTSGELTFNEETIHGCDSIVTLNLTVQTRTGLAINLETAIMLYPNPARHELRIAIDGNITVKSLEIVDASGRSVHVAINPMRSIDVSRLPQGIYFARIETDKGIVVKRFVKE